MRAGSGGPAAGKADGRTHIKNEHNEAMGLPTAFSSKTKLWSRSKFPYESSFALLQLRHWLFCFDGGNSRCRYCMVHGHYVSIAAISAALFA